MKLYLTPGACSLADHIALHEGKFTFDHVKVDLKEKKTEDGKDFNTINPKGYIPALVMDDGELLTENVAILSWIAEQRPALAPQGGAMSRTRLIEMLTFISTEIHKQFKPFFAGGTDDAKKAATQMIKKRFDYMKGKIKGDFIFDTMTVADCYLFTVLTWANKVGIEHGLDAYFENFKKRPSVQAAFKHEGLS